MQKILNQESFLKVTIENVSQVYLGRNNVCRCGCAGTYTATSFMKDPRSEVNDQLVVKRLKRAKQLVLEGAEADFNGSYANIVTGNDRALTFYFDEM